MQSEMQWQKPLTPWRTVQQRFFAEKGLDPVPFSAKYGLDEQAVRMVIGEMYLAFPDDLCEALAKETGMTPEFFRNLSDQYLKHAH